MKVLDLFCCCGGISEGIATEDHEVTGVDIKNDHEYRYNFVHSDVFKLPLEFFKKFDLIFASPPCQEFTRSVAKWKTKAFFYQYPNLIDKTRKLLLKTGKPFIIENVVGAPIRRDLILCGEMFDLRVVRHRKFEIHKAKVRQPQHEKHKPKIDGYLNYYYQIAGHGGESYSFKFSDWKRAINISWVNSKEHLVQMIPPDYSAYIMRNIKILK